MANRWENNGNSDFIFLGSKITADGDYSHDIKKHLLLGRNTMTNLDSILKSRDITLPTKVHLVKAMVFPASQRHPGKFPKVPGRRRGKRGFPAAPPTKTSRVLLQRVSRP